MNDGGPGLLTPQALTFLALVAFPVLAFACAVLGLILVLQGKTAVSYTHLRAHET